MCDGRLSLSICSTEAITKSRLKIDNQRPVKNESGRAVYSDVNMDEAITELILINNPHWYCRIDEWLRRWRKFLYKRRLLQTQNEEKPV